MDEVRTVTFPEVTAELLSEAVRRILQVGSPRKIVLFGSRAGSNARPDSDLDLLIVEDSSELPRYRRPSRYRLALCGLFPAKDVVVWTLSEIQQWAAVPEAFITTVLNDGRVLSERSG